MSDAPLFGRVQHGMLFQEVQHFWSNRLLVAVWAVMAPFGLLLLFAPHSRQPAGVGLVLVGAPLLLMAASLKTEVTTDGVLVVGFHPMRRGRRRISARSVISAESVSYSPAGDFGGWGWRIGWGGEVAYNVHGKRGVRLTLDRNRTVLVGSQRPDDLVQALHAAREGTERLSPSPG